MPTYQTLVPIIQFDINEIAWIIKLGINRLNADHSRVRGVGEMRSADHAPVRVFSIMICNAQYRQTG